MKNIKFKYTKITFFLALVFLVTISCERDLSDEVEFATFPDTGEIFIDNPIGMGTDFYFPFGGSKPTAWSVDSEVSYEGTSSMRFDIPNFGDPAGSYAGAIFRIDGDGSGRDLTGYDALTFWAKGSEARTINDIGFGQDFLENKYQVKAKGALQLTTNWVKYIIPIPDASKLIQERGMLWYAEGPNEDGTGWTFWIDELKFEKLGTLAQARPTILDGETVEQAAFIGIPVEVTGLTQTFNSASGENLTVVASPSYFDFKSSNPSVATVDEFGVVTLSRVGVATITASIAGVEAEGSLTLNVAGGFDFAPTPPSRNAEDVISIFSDAYNNVPVDYYNGFFLDGFQTTEGGAPPLDVNGDAIINYTLLNFVAIGTFQDVSSVNITEMTHLHMDIKVNEAVDSGDYIDILLLNDVGGNETEGRVSLDSSNFEQGEWVSIDIPIADFGLSDRTKIGLLFFISDATITDIFVDNVYYYKQ